MATVCAVWLVAQGLAAFPKAGLDAPAPPKAHADRRMVFGAEFGLTLLVFGAGMVFAALPKKAQPFANAAFYCACAFTEGGRYSGALVNPAAVIALHTYRLPLASLMKPASWAPAVSPYLLGICSAAMLLGISQRQLRAPRRRAVKAKAD